jgi:hypothetical protein
MKVEKRLFPFEIELRKTVENYDFIQVRARFSTFI